MEKTYRLVIEKNVNETSPHLFATCKDLPDLLVHGENLKILLERTRRTISGLLPGKEIISLELKEPNDKMETPLVGKKVNQVIEVKLAA